jgi:hypothetical protein
MDSRKNSRPASFPVANKPGKSALSLAQRRVSGLVYGSFPSAACMTACAEDASRKLPRNQPETWDRPRSGSNCYEPALSAFVKNKGCADTEDTLARNLLSRYCVALNP